MKSYNEASILATNGGRTLMWTRKRRHPKKGKIDVRKQVSLNGRTYEEAMDVLMEAEAELNAKFESQFADCPWVLRPWYTEYVSGKGMFMIKGMVFKDANIARYPNQKTSRINAQAPYWEPIDGDVDNLKFHTYQPFVMGHYMPVGAKKRDRLLVPIQDEKTYYEAYEEVTKWLCVWQGWTEYIPEMLDLAPDYSVICQRAISFCREFDEPIRGIDFN